MWEFFIIKNKNKITQHIVLDMLQNALKMYRKKTALYQGSPLLFLKISR